MSNRIEIWYIGCILPSSATHVSAGEVADGIKSFTDDLAGMGQKAATVFDEKSGEQIYTVVTQAGQATVATTKFILKLDDIVRQHGDSPDQFYITKTDQPGAPDEETGQIFPSEKGTRKDMRAGSSLLYTGERGKEPITATLGAQDGLACWDHDDISGDDFLFSLNNKDVFRTDVAVGSGGSPTHVALDKDGVPIEGKAGLEIEGVGACPQGLYGKMFNHDIIFNAKEAAVYRIVWTLVPIT